MRATLVSLTALFLAVLTLMTGSGLLGSLLGVRLAQMGTAPALTGIVMAGFYAGLVVGAFFCHRVIRRVGHIRAFAAFGALNAAVVLMHPLLPKPLFWLFLRLATGVAMMGIYMVIESWLNERADRAIRGRVFSIYMVTTFAGLGGGQFLLMLDQADGSNRMFLLIGVLFALCLIPISITRAVHPRPLDNTRLPIRELLRRAPVGVFGCVGAGLINGALYALGPVFAHDRGLSTAGVAAFMGVTILGGLALQWPMGLVSDRHDRRSVLALLAVAVAGAAVLIIAGGKHLEFVLPAAALYGGMAFTLYPISVAYANDHVDASELVPASAALNLAYGVGAASGPILAALVMTPLGAPGLFTYTAVAAVILAGMTWYGHANEAVSVEEQAPFIPVPRTSAVIAELDPRADEEAEAGGSEPPPPAT